MSELAQSLPWGRDEDGLITELQAGSESAFDYLVSSYHASVYNLVYGILGDAADAADVTQDVFLRVFRGIRGFRRSSSLKTWLYRVSVRQALNHRRWCWRHHRLQISIDSDAEEKSATLELRIWRQLLTSSAPRMRCRPRYGVRLRRCQRFSRRGNPAGSRRAFVRGDCRSGRGYCGNGKIANFAGRPNAERHPRSGFAFRPGQASQTTSQRTTQSGVPATPRTLRIYGDQGSILKEVHGVE